MSNRWPTLRIMLTAHGSFTVILWLLVIAATALVTTGIAIWGDVDRSYWHYAATQATRWLALGLGIDVINTYLRLHIAHGRTRKDFMRQLVPYVAGLSVSLGLLVTLGYLLERGVHALAGWPYRLPFPSWGDYPLADASYPSMFGAFTLTLLLWTLAGVVVAAAFVRNVVLGVGAVLLGILIIAPIEIRLGWGGIQELSQATEDDLELAMPSVVGWSLLGVVVAGAAIWGILRDIPMRPKVA